MKVYVGVCHNILDHEVNVGARNAQKVIVHGLLF